MIGILQPLMSGLKLDEDQRNAVYKSYQISTALVEFASDPELRCQ